MMDWKIEVLFYEVQLLIKNNSPELFLIRLIATSKTFFDTLESSIAAKILLNKSSIPLQKKFIAHNYYSLE